MPNFRKYVLGIGFCAALLLLGGLNILTFQSTNKLLLTTRWVDHTHKVIESLDLYLSLMTDTETGQRGFLLTGKDAYLQPYNAALAKVATQLTTLERLTADDRTHQEKLRQMRRLTDEKLRLMRVSIDRRHAGGALDASIGSNLDRGKAVMDHIRSLANAMMRDERQLLAQRTDEAQRSAAGMNRLRTLGTLCGAALLVGVFALLAREINISQRAQSNIATLHTDLQGRMEEVEAVNQELEAFSYTISHDLRGPLRAMDGFSRILQDEHGEEFSADAAMFVERIRANAQQMGQLVDDLLAFSRLGRQPLRVARVDMSEIVLQACEELHPSLHDGPGGHRVMLTIGVLPPCYGDARLLRQVVVNLLSNALKYSRNREVAKIEIGAMTGDSSTADAAAHGSIGKKIYFVRDNGTGFNMKYYDKLFGVFNRLHRAEDYEGTGVGLAIVQRVVQRHGGKVWAESVEGEGATFYFTIEAT